MPPRVGELTLDGFPRATKHTDKDRYKTARARIKTLGGPNATHGETQTVTAIALENAEPSELHPILRSEVLCDLASLER